MDIVILGYTAHPYTRAILGECKRRGIPIKALVQRTRIDYPPELVLQNLRHESSTKWGFLKQSVTLENLKRAIYNPGFALRFLKQSLSKNYRAEERQSHPEHIAVPDDINFREITVKTVSDFNSISSQRLLRQMAPDLIILGPAAQIIKGGILRIPRIGTLNAHQGLLPKYRGMDVLEYSILNGDEPGVTVHFVDEGVDTGDIILRRHLPVPRGVTLEDLWEQAIQLSVKALADAIEIIQGGNYQTEQQDIKDGKQFYPIHPVLRDIVRLKLQGYATT